YMHKHNQLCILSSLIISADSILFFFFQAEDGIRDLIVTGVQTCALPISAGQLQPPAPQVAVRTERTQNVLGTPHQQPAQQLIPRSEERRVGKECRYRWAPDH